MIRIVIGSSNVLLFFAGICKMSEKAHFEENMDIDDIRKEKGTESLNLRELEMDGM